MGHDRDVYGYEHDSKAYVLQRAAGLLNCDDKRKDSIKFRTKLNFNFLKFFSLETIKLRKLLPYFIRSSPPLATSAAMELNCIKTALDSAPCFHV